MQRGYYLGKHPLLSVILSLTCDRVFSMIHHQHHARALSSIVRVPSLPCTALHYPRKPVPCQPTAHHYGALRAWKKASEQSSRGCLDNSMGKLFRLLQSSHLVV